LSLVLIDLVLIDLVLIDLVLIDMGLTPERSRLRCRYRKMPSASLLPRSSRRPGVFARPRAEAP